MASKGRQIQASTRDIFGEEPGEFFERGSRPAMRFYATSQMPAARPDGRTPGRIRLPRRWPHVAPHARLSLAANAARSGGAVAAKPEDFGQYLPGVAVSHRAVLG